MLAASPASAQVGKLVDPNMASESDLQQLPHMTPAIVKGMIEKRAVQDRGRAQPVPHRPEAHADEAKGFLPQGVRADQT